jgi:hypothetical protein
MAIPAALEPGPLVTLVRCLTVAKVDSMGVGRAQVDPVLGRVVVEGQQFFHVVGDLGGGLGPLGAVQLVEGADGGAGVILVLIDVEQLALPYQHNATSCIILRSSKCATRAGARGRPQSSSRDASCI